jgi:competence protein ComEC
MATSAEIHSSGETAALPSQRSAVISHAATGRSQINAVSVERPHGAYSSPLLLVAAASAGGIVADRYLAFAGFVWLALTVVVLLVWLFLYRRQLYSEAAWALLVAFACCGGLWHHLHWRVYADDDLGRFARHTSQPVCAEVIALAAPMHRPAPPIDPLRSLPQGAHTRVRVRATALRDAGKWRRVDGRAALIVEGTLLGVHAGDRLRIVGQIQSTSPPGNPGEFDFALDRRADRELGTIRVDDPSCVQVVETASMISWRRILGDLRAAGDRLLWSTLSHERAGLASAVLLGAREELDDDQKHEFLVTGTIHILSISGLHVGILALVLFTAFRTGLVRRRPALAGVAFITLAYTLLTDSEPPAVRATVLVWVICGGMLLGRVTSAANSLAAAAIVVLAINPADLFRTGTQLSFLSVAVLSAVAQWWYTLPREEPLARLIRRTRPLPVQWLRLIGGKVAALAFAGLMIWLVTAPLVLHRFHVISFSALVLNVVLWLPVFLAMASGFGVLAIGWLLPPVGVLFAAICDLNLGIIEETVAAAARLPGSYAWTAGPPQGWLIVFYALIAAPILVPWLITSRRSFGLVGLWTAIGVGIAGINAAKATPQELTCGFVSVGHGCAVVLELPDGQVWLYDAGRLGSPRAGARSIEAYLRSRRISQIDAIILSHADIDHYNAVPELLEKFDVRAVYVSPQMFRVDIPPLRALQQALNRVGVEVDTLSGGDELVAGECRARVLHPPHAGVSGSDNANSIVLAVEYAGRRVLLTGDLEPPGVENLLGKPSLDCDILLAPHHGSPRSSPAAIVNWSTPEWAVISTAHPFMQNAAAYPALLGPRALNTAEVGAVRAVLRADDVDVRAWRVDPWE